MSYFAARDILRVLQAFLHLAREPQINQQTEEESCAEDQATAVLLVRQLSCTFARTHREEISTSGVLFGQHIVTYSFFSPLKIH